MKTRDGETRRETGETRIRMRLGLDGPPSSSIRTGLPFLDHMLDAFATHGRFALEAEAQGDVQVDPHHLVEDCGICLGATLAEALKDGRPTARAGCFLFPMDRSLAQVALDLCGRPNLVWEVELEPQPLGGIDPRLFQDFFKGLADAARATIHVRLLARDNDHHAVEAVFKAFGRALREAVAPVEGSGPVSTKGKIDA